MAHAPTDSLGRRHQAMRQELAARALDAIVVTSRSNILYLTNFTGSTGIAILDAARMTLITDARYTTAVALQQAEACACPNLDVIQVESTYDGTLAATLDRYAGGRVGFEGAHISVSRHAWLDARLDNATPRSTLVATEGVVERARVIKDAYELKTLKEAGTRLSRAAIDVLSQVRRGQSERDVARIIETALNDAGFERPAFETIVASGPQAALPHAKPSERILSEGDVVVLDFGGVYDSYCVDLTRTVSIGPATARARTVHDAVRVAHSRALQAVAPGVSRFTIDDAARNALAEAGMADAFGHGTGHGLGIDIHEDPRIGRRRPEGDGQDDAVATGMVFTIEPGAYFPGWGGVRIEDDVVVTEKGMELLTSVPTDLIER